MRDIQFHVKIFSLLVFMIICLVTEPLVAQNPLPGEVNYDIVYIRAPRFGDDVRTRIPEVNNPIKMEPGTDLMLLHPDGSEEMLVPGGQGTIIDPYVSFDGKWVFYAKVHDQTNLNNQRSNAARSGSDIFKINLETRQNIQLTFQEWTPNTGVGSWSNNPLNADPPGKNYLGYGIYNLGPCPLPNGKLIFTSSRNGFLPNKSYTFPNLQLFVMDQDGRNVEETGHLNLGSALHPTILMDGRVMFSSYEAQGLRNQLIWGLWSIWPDGTNWGPLMSGFAGPFAFHWQAQLSDGSVVVDDYYNQNNAGFGTFLKFPISVPTGNIAFGSPDPKHASNPALPFGWHENGKVRYERFPFSPYGIESLTPFTTAQDFAAPFINGTGTERTGKVTQPSGAPNNDLLLVWTPGPANDLNRPINRPVYDAGLYLMAGGNAVSDHRQLILIKNDPNFNEQQPRAVLPYRAIYGIDEPQALPWLPNNGSQYQELPEGTPYGLIGTSTFYRRDSKPGVGKAEFNGLDPFNTSENYSSTNWTVQGADAGFYNDDEMFAVRIVALEPTSHLSYGPNYRYSHSGKANWNNHADERMRILGEIPLRKFDPSGNIIRDSDGNPDTSFLAKIPADVPFTFQTVDRDGMVLNSSQTWHQVRPGEVRHDCGGCHGHSQSPMDFSTTAAARSDYQILDLANTTPLITKNVNKQPSLKTLPQGVLDVEYYRDIKPIFQRSCVLCHSKTGTQEANLVLDDETLVGGYDNTYHRLANDPNSQYGIPALVTYNGQPLWRHTNASRYIRKFQSRRSLLIWKIFGRRLDGWSNADHPSAAVPGDPTTLPGGGNKNEINRSDIDYTGTIMPPPGSGVPPLTEDEKILFARWVDLGAPITSQEPERQTVGWFADELRPTLTLSSPRAGYSPVALDTIRIGAHDFNTGLDVSSFSVKTNFIVNGHPAGTELSGLFQQTNDHIWSLQLSPSIPNLTDGQITVRIKDNQGNWSEIRRDFGVRTEGETPPLSDTTPPGSPPGLKVQVISSVQIDVSWLAASDDVGVTEYVVFRNELPLGTTANLSFVDTMVTPGTSYTYTVRAEDAASNQSAWSNAVTVTSMPSTASPTDAATSTVMTGAGSVSADGTSSATITVKLYDNLNVPVVGHAVSLAQGVGSSTIFAASGPSDGNGQVFFTVTNLTAETVTYRATDVTDSVTLTQTTAVVFSAAVPGPTVTINQAVGQADPTNTSPINFTVVFSEPVADFTNDDVTLGGTASATMAIVTGSGTNYNVAVSGTGGAYTWDGNSWADYSGFMSPITSGVKANLRFIMAVGETKGRVLGRMGQVGDSITFSSAYFRNGILQGPSVNETNHDYSDVRSWMAYSGTQPADSSSFYGDLGKGPDYGNFSGWSIGDAVGANHPFRAIEVGDTLTPGNFSWALLMFGTNDIDNPSWDADTWKSEYSAFVQGFINVGVIPVLSTIPPEQAHINDGRVEAANEQIRSLANELNIPFVDFYALVVHFQPINWVGTLISGAGTHPSASGGGRDFSQNALTTTDGYAARTKLAWDIAEKLKAIVFEDGNPEALFFNNGNVTASIAAGAATNSLGNPSSPSTSTDNEVTVTAALTALTITPPTGSVEVGLTLGLTAMGTFSDGSTADLSTSVTWTSSSPTIATISNTGVVTGVTVGSTDLTASRDGVTSGMVLVKVPPPIVSDTSSPSSPSGLKAHVVSFAQIDVSWLAASDDVGVTAYRVFRNELPLGTTATLSFVDTAVLPETSYTYTVRAEDAASNQSALSNVVTVSTPIAPDTTPPSSPQGLKAEVVVSWQAASDDVGVTGYMVYRNDLPLITTTNLSFLDTMVEPGLVVGTTDVPHLIYAKRFPPGQVTLRGNGDIPMAGAKSMYTVVIEPSLVSNVTVANGKSYEVDTLASGKSVYIDRTYTYTEIPLALDGQTYIRTANNDKFEAEANFLTFDVATSVTVYVLMDARTAQLPAWLGDGTWTLVPAQYTYTVQAEDAASNQSAQSDAVTVTVSKPAITKPTAETTTTTP